MIEALPAAYSLWAPIGLILAHFLWQGAGVTMILAIGLWVMRHRSPNARYAMCGVAMLIMAMCPAATFWYTRVHSVFLAGPARGAFQSPAHSVLPETTGQQNSILLPGRPLAEPGAIAPVPVANAPTQGSPISGSTDRGGANVGPIASMGNSTWSFLTDGPMRLKHAWYRAPEQWLCQVLVLGAVLWAAGVAALAVRLMVGCLGLRRLRRSEPTVLPAAVDAAVARLRAAMGIPARVRVLAASVNMEPLAFGLLRPVVLVPVSLIAQCPLDLLEGMIAHELAHIRRYDLWVNLFQRVVEVLLFFHPGVRWVSDRMRLERELCCDDLAVIATGKRVEYAEALVRISESSLFGARLSLAAGILGRRITMIARVRRVLGLPQGTERSRFWMAGPFSLMIAASLIMMAHLRPSYAQPMPAPTVSAQPNLVPKAPTSTTSSEPVRAARRTGGPVAPPAAVPTTASPTGPLPTAPPIAEAGTTAFGAAEASPPVAEVRPSPSRQAIPPKAFASKAERAPSTVEMGEGSFGGGAGGGVPGRRTADLGGGRTVAARSSQETWSVRAKSEGLVEKILVKQGQSVKEGELVAQLYDEDIRIDLTKAQVRFEAAMQALDLANKAYEKGALGSKDRGDAERDLRLAKLDVEQATKRVARMEVRSPAKGVVAMIVNDLKDKKVQAGETLMVIQAQPVPSTGPTPVGFGGAQGGGMGGFGEARMPSAEGARRPSPTPAPAGARRTSPVPNAGGGRGAPAGPSVGGSGGPSTP